MQKFQALQKLGEDNKNSIPVNLRGGGADGFRGRKVKLNSLMGGTGWTTAMPNYFDGLNWYKGGLHGEAEDWLNSTDITGPGELTKGGAESFASNYEQLTAAFKALQDQYLLMFNNAMSGPGKFLDSVVFGHQPALETLRRFYKRPIDTLKFDGLAGISDILKSMDLAGGFGNSDFSIPFDAIMDGSLPKTAIEILEKLRDGPLQGMRGAAQGSANEIAMDRLGYIPWDILSGLVKKQNSGPFDDAVFGKTGFQRLGNLQQRMQSAQGSIKSLQDLVAFYAGADIMDPAMTADIGVLLPGVLAAGMDSIYNAFEGGDMGIGFAEQGVDVEAWKQTNAEAREKLRLHALIYEDLRNNAGGALGGDQMGGQGGLEGPAAGGGFGAALNLLGPGSQPWMSGATDEENFMSDPAFGQDADNDGINDHWQHNIDTWHFINDKLAQDLAGQGGAAFDNAAGGPAGLGLLAEAVADRQKEDKDAAARAAAEQAAQDRLLGAMMKVWWINSAEKVKAMKRVLGDFPGANAKSPLRGPRVPDYSGLYKKDGGVGPFNQPAKIQMVTNLPRTAEAFDAMFPYLHALGFDTWNLGKTGAITGVDAKAGVQYDPMAIRNNIGATLPQLAHWAKNDPIDWHLDAGKGRRYLQGGETEMKYTGLFMTGNVRAIPAGLQMLDAGVKEQQKDARDAINAAWQMDWNANLNLNSPVANALRLAGLANEPWLFQPNENRGQAPVRRAAGGPIPGGINWAPRGTDTVPAMLTPGEFVMKKSAVDKYGMSFMSAINEGKGGSRRGGFSSGGPVYLQNGGPSGNIEMPSFGDVIDNFDRVFQTYDDTQFGLAEFTSKLGTSSSNIAVGTKDLAAQFPAVTNALNNFGSLIGGDLSNAGSIISSSLASFTEAFTLFSGLSSMLSNTINSMADMNITHNININGSLAIPGFSQEDINGIIENISNGVTRGVDEKIKQAFAERDTKQENDAG